MKGIDRFSTLLEGFLPNQIAWDAKPAFVFWWFGGVIELFGKTIPAASLLPSCGSSCQPISCTGQLCLLRAAGSAVVFAAGMLIVAGSSYSLNVSAEHLALLPMARAVLVFCIGGPARRNGMH